MADTPDQRPDDMTTALDRSELPPTLWPLHGRLVADGARWRRRAPDGRDLSAWARATLLAAPPSAEPANTPRLRERRLDAHDELLSRPKGTRILMDSSNNISRARWTGIAGALAATVVVGLLAALLVHNAATRGTGAKAEATNTSTNLPGTLGPTDTPGSQGSSGNFLQPGQLPVVSASDTQIAYLVNNNQVQRSTNGGKTFAPTTQPKTGLSQTDFTGLAVSPLNANTVFYNVGGLKNGQGCQPASQVYGALTQHGGIMASGYVPCTAQMISTDGGQTWRTLKLPTGGVLGGPQGYRAMQQFNQNAQQYSIQAQGQRLYSAVAFADDGGSLIDSPGIRLVASDDGGASWKLIDAALVRSGRIVCDFAAAPTGATLYATTSPDSCGGMGTFPAITLWRSDNGGQSWQGPIRNLPTLAENGMVVSSQGWLYTYTPDVTAQGHGASATSTPANAIVSKDGGRTFSPAPSVGVPTGASLAGPFATLSDGSVVYALQGGDPATSANDTLYSWKPGASSWTKLTGAIANGLNAVIVTPAPAGGDTLTITTNAGAVITLSTPY